MQHWFCDDGDAAPHATFCLGQAGRDVVDAFALQHPGVFTDVAKCGSHASQCDALGRFGGTQPVGVVALGVGRCGFCVDVRGCCGWWVGWLLCV